MQVRSAAALRVAAVVLAAVGVAVLSGGCQREQRGKVEIVTAPLAGDVAQLVQAELTRAQQDRKQLLVYVGATWCEPCRNFHAAAASGQLDAQLPTLRLLEFDADRDNERLAFAGYFSQYIPLFALPKADGHASGKQVEGAAKGAAVAEQLVPKLRKLLAP
jgi:thiol:disulfide interchange protein